MAGCTVSNHCRFIDEDLHRNGKDEKTVSSLCSDESLYNFHLNTFGPKHSLDCLVFQESFTGSLKTHYLEFFNAFPIL